MFNSLRRHLPNGEPVANLTEEDKHGTRIMESHFVELITWANNYIALLEKQLAYCKEHCSQCDDEGCHCHAVPFDLTNKS